MKKQLMKGLLLSTLSAAAGSAGAADVFLAAKAFDKTLLDGDVVPMWGYVEDTGGLCYNTGANGATAIANRLACVNALPDPQTPGPRLDLTDGDLNIYLSNGLPEPTSLVITGQENPVSIPEGPTYIDPENPGIVTIGSRTNATQRVRSFVGEAAASGGSGSYSWSLAGENPLGVGTAILHSGTHPQKQVYMGLYSAVTLDAVPAAAGSLLAEAYPGVFYENEVVLFYSEIDVDLNKSINCTALGNCAASSLPEYTTSIDYHPRWFLVNGEPYSTECTDVAPPDTFDDASGYPCANMAQTDDIFAGNGGKTTTLVRFLSTAGETHVPTLQGVYMTIHAEDGNPYNWQNGVVEGGAAPRTQYSVQLPPLMTKDAILHALPANGERFAVYDGNGNMTNPTDPKDFDAGDPVGGMLRFLGPELDSDDDGVPDALDNCPVGFNPDQADEDMDGAGNACDNCIAVANNPDAEGNFLRDTDSDGYGNMCDGDLDGDGDVDFVDYSIFGPRLFVTPADPDADFDGDGNVDFIDYSLFGPMLFQPLGPSCIDLPGGCPIPLP